MNNAKLCISTVGNVGICNVRTINYVRLLHRFYLFFYFQGDSGGPLVLMDSEGNYRQIGISSFVSWQGCAVGDPGAFTRVSSYTDNFIRQFV
jgi:Trypsin